MCQHDWETRTSRSWTYLPSHMAHCFLSILLSHYIQHTVFCCRWEKKLQTKHSGPCTCTWSLLSMQSWLCCLELNFHSAGTILPWLSRFFQNFHRAAGQEPGMLLPFVSEAVFLFFFIACHAQQSTRGGSSGVTGGGRSLDCDHYLVNKMSTRCFLDTLLSKSRKVQKWTPPSQWAP